MRGKPPRRRAPAPTPGSALLARCSIPSPRCATGTSARRPTAARSPSHPPARHAARAGMPLVESLGALVEQVEKPGLKRMLTDVKTQVNEGSSLADALARHPKVFEDCTSTWSAPARRPATSTRSSPPRRLPRGAEAARQDQLGADLPDRDDRHRRRHHGHAHGHGRAQGDVDLRRHGKALPWNTQLLIAISDTVSSWNWLVLHRRSSSVASCSSAAGSARRAARAVVDRIVLKMPVVGQLARTIAITRFARTLATMLASGVPLLRALDIVKNVLGNTVLQKVGRGGAATRSARASPSPRRSSARASFRPSSPT